MSSDVAISVDDLSKCFHIYDKPRDRLMQMILRGRKKYYREFWALQHVSFEISRGETVGIVGRNGSGKSTLLQIICGTLNATHGSISTNGRIAALLELGSGFNPEFTGRENVYMNAAVLGLSNKETDARFDDIAQFADIGDFIDQPVKTYSSGMMVRLAFAVAINVDPEILIVDEALSVGDELFQRKCFSRIEAIRKAGATILFVSHSGGTIVELCDRAILMDAGENLAIGHPKAIIAKYQKLLYAPQDKYEALREVFRSSPELASNNTHDQRSGDNTIIATVDLEQIRAHFDPNLIPISTIEYEPRGALINCPRILNRDEEQVNNLIRGETYIYEYRVKFTSYAERVRFGMMVKTLSGIELGGASTAVDTGSDLGLVVANSSFNIRFRFRCSLNAGVYFLNAGVVGMVDGTETYLHRIVDVAMFRVVAESNSLVTGIIDFSCEPEYLAIGN
ncbi:ATP-binding cassette domain-containing protein [Pusillimonas sp. TS35]|nr:ATP-binding cassette domain-containing protein [Pusillimonas sp. TS35]